MNMPAHIPVKKMLFLFSIIAYSQSALSQDEASSRSYHFNGSVSVTNNGFSFVPTFSLGEPATIIDLSVGGKRFSFEPQFRFELQGLKPWSFIAIWRYDLVQTSKTKLRLGVHFPGFSYLKQTIEIDGVMTEQIYTQRWFTPELTFSTLLTDNIQIGTYYIHGIGLEPEGQINHTDFISLRMGFDVTIAKHWFLQWKPQAYYLRMDELGGFFAAQLISFGHKKFPISISSMMNKSLEDDNEIPSKDFDWNISLIYSFKNSFKKQ